MAPPAATEKLPMAIRPCGDDELGLGDRQRHACVDETHRLRGRRGGNAKGGRGNFEYQTDWTPYPRGSVECVEQPVTEKGFQNRLQNYQE
jgi:hypothetical protein